MNANAGYILLLFSVVRIPSNTQEAACTAQRDSNRRLTKNEAIVYHKMFKMKKRG